MATPMLSIKTQHRVKTFIRTECGYIVIELRRQRERVKYVGTRVPGTADNELLHSNATIVFVLQICIKPCMLIAESE